MYQVWIKQEFDESWRLTECETLDDVKDAVLESMKQGQPTMVTRRMGVRVVTEITEAEEPPAAPADEVEPTPPAESKQEETIEAKEGRSSLDQGPGAPGNSPV